MGSAAPHTAHVLIVGAGIGGLFLAQFLRKQGVSFSIFERDASPEARTAGWAIGLSMLDDFASFMPDDVPPLRSTCHLLPLDLPSQFIMYPPGGARIGVEDCAETPCVRANRKRLRQLLLTGVPVQWGRQAVRIEEDDTTHSVRVHFQDGTASAWGDLLVGADGTWSKTREHVLGGRSNAETLQAVPMAMIYGETTLTNDVSSSNGNGHGNGNGNGNGTTTTPTTSALEDQLRLGHSSYIAIAQPSGTIFFCGLDRVTPSGDTASFYWFLYMRDNAAADPDHWLRTATREQKYEHVLKRTAEVQMDPKYTEIVRRGSPADVNESFSLYYDAILRDLPNKGRRVLLIGDAAHPTTPFRGEGGIMAIKDALQLSALLATSDVKADDGKTFQTALDDFQHEVTERGATVVQMSRDAVLGTGGPPKGKPRSWGFEVRPIPPSTGSLGLGGTPVAAAVTN